MQFIQNLILCDSKELNNVLCFDNVQFRIPTNSINNATRGPHCFQPVVINPIIEKLNLW